MPRDTTHPPSDPFPAFTLVQSPDQPEVVALTDTVPHDPPVPPFGYALHGELARGGMGVLFTATDTALGRDVAIKTVQARFGTDPTAVRRFTAEARITGRLEHPGIPPVHVLGTLPDGRPFLAMKLIHGRTLGQLLRNRPDPTADRPRFIDVFGQIAQTLGFAHGRGYIHRDLKPANVMVGAFGEVQVMDWGLAKRVPSTEYPVPSTEEPPDPPATAHDEPSSTVVQFVPPGSTVMPAGHETQAGAVVGTPAYMAPEQARGEPVDARADVFGLGAILCSILTGHPPYNGPSVLATLTQAAVANLSDAFARLDGCGADPELLHLCRQCLAANPADRPADGIAVAEAVRAAEVERAKEAVRRKEERRRTRLRRLLGAAILGAVVLILGGGWAFHVQEERRAAERAADQLAGRLRARAAVDVLAERAAAAVVGNRIPEADALLKQAEPQLPEADDPQLADRITGLRRDADTVRLLDTAVDKRWEQPGNQTLSEYARPGFAAAFARAGLDIGSTPPADVAAAVRGSRIADRLLVGLHEWLEADPQMPGLVTAVNAVDPDPLRSAVRTAVAAGDRAAVRARLKDVDGAALPPAFATLIGFGDWLPPAAATRLMTAAYDRNPNSFPLAMTTGAVVQAPQTRDAALTAVGYFRAAAALRPDNVRPRLMLATAFNILEDYPAAEAEAMRAIALMPDASRPRSALADVLYNAGQYDRAEAAYREALARSTVNRTRATAVSGLGNVAYARDRFAEAAAAYKQADAWEPDVSHVIYYGEALEASGDLAGGLAAFEAAVGRPNPRAYARIRLGQAYLERRRFRDAADVLGHPAVAETPYASVPLRMLADAQAESGQFDAAAATAERAAAKLPAGSPERAPFDSVAERTRRTARTAQLTAEVLRGGDGLPPTDLLGLTARANVLRVRGQWEEAVGVYELLFERAAKGNIDVGAMFELNAARSAVRAAGTVSPDRRPRLRELACRWLTGEATRLRDRATASGAGQESRLTARRSAGLLLADADLAELRQGTGLLPTERADWGRVWELLHAAAGGREPAPGPRRK